MDDGYDVPDSTDWLSTPLKDFAALENALHCQVCKEFYDTPMITSCNHTFCSKCIRTSLSADGKCPACRAADQASKLRNNWALQEVVSTFLTARKPALEVARRSHEQSDAPKRPGKRKRNAVLDSDDVAEMEAASRTTRSKSRRIAASQSSQQEAIEIEDSEADEGDEEVQEVTPDDGLVECPLGCGKRMKEEAVFGHLDKCEDEKKQASRAKSRTPLNGFVSARPSSSNNSKPQDRINELNYSMMKDAPLAKKLKDLGLPSSGSKQLMINRHKEWVNIWNANCDSNHPRSRRDLLHDLDVWERTQGGKAPTANGLSSTIMRKDFDGDAYARRHQDDFSRLIADAKRKKNNPATEPTIAKEAGAHDEDPEPPPVNGEHKKSHFFSDTAPATAMNDRRPTNKDIPPLKTEFSGDPKPYENNPEAISSIREKVEALNHGEQITPLLNEGFKNTSTRRFSGESPSVSPRRTSLDLIRPQSREPPSMFGTTITPVRSRQGSMSKASAGGSSLSRQQSKDEHFAGKTGSPCEVSAHILDNPRKVPMLEVPEHPVDVDGSGGALGA